MFTQSPTMHAVLKGFALLLMVFLVAPAPVSAAVNLIQNPSFETGSDAPASWTTAGWGSSTKVFNYATSDAPDGERSVGVEVSNFVDGDAKWLFDDVAVEGGKNYFFSDMYKSDVPSRIVARFNAVGDSCVTADTGCTYLQLAELPAVSEWTTFQTQFMVPENTASLTIFHLIEGNGSLELDAFVLEKIVEIEVEDGIPNHSVEHDHVGEGGTEVPVAWYQSSWGENSPVFEYVTTEGQEGDRSVKVELTAHASGDAKWYYEPQSVTSGKDYRFSAYYKSNDPQTVIPHVVVQFTKANGDISYFGLQRPQPQSADWQFYEDEFAVPSGVVKATVFFFIDTVGWIQTDNYKIESYAYDGFDDAIVTLTFDDGAESNIDTVLPLVNSLGIKTTHCYMTDYLDDPVQQERVIELYNSGHEICSHTVTHPDLTTLNNTELTAELTESQDLLASLIGKPVPNFASPFGAYNEHVNDVIKDIYQSHRTVDEGYNSKDNLDIYRLKVQNMKPTTTFAEFKEWVDKAKADETWLILVYHDVNTEAVGVTPFGTYTPDFNEQMNWLATAGVEVKTYQDALVEVCSQVDDSVCDLASTTTPVVCPAGQHLEGTTCVPDTTGTTTPSSNLIPNPQLELAGGVSGLLSWLTGKWGTNDATLSYPVSGNEGNGAAVTISSYTDGDAKWYFEPVSVLPNTEYTFSDRFKSTTASEVVVEYTLADNTNSYGLFASVPSSGDVWTTYSANITTPANATALTIFHLINSIGSLTVDDYMLEVAATSTASTTEPVTCPAGQHVEGETCVDDTPTEPVPTAEELQAQINALVVTFNAALAEENKTLGSCVWLDTSVGATAEGLQSQITQLLSALADMEAGSSTINGCPLLDVTPVPVVCASNQVVVDNQCVDKPRRSGGGGGGGRRSTPSQSVATTTVVTTTATSGTNGGSVLGASTTNAANFIFNVNLAVGMSGTDVMELQKRLALEGFYTGPVTGYFGPLTLEAVKKYQAHHGIPDTGTVGQMTRDKLNAGGVGGNVASLQMQLFAALKLLAELQAKLKELKGGA